MEAYLLAPILDQWFIHVRLFGFDFSVAYEGASSVSYLGGERATNNRANIISAALKRILMNKGAGYISPWTTTLDIHSPQAR